MPAVTIVPPSGNPDIDGVLALRKWAVSTLSYSFPASAAFYGPGYGSGEPLDNFAVLNSTQQSAARAALAGYAAVANIRFSEVAESASAHADLRYASSDAPGTAWAYYPATQSYGGDSWYNHSRGSYDTPIKGTYAYHTFLHETGHALGLKHGQETPAVPAAHDSMEYTVMTYHSYVGQAGANGYTNGSGSYAQTLMMLDIAAIQYLYGANYATNSGNTTYTWSPVTGELSIDGARQGAPLANRVLMTMWDGGGTDTYDFSGYTTGVSADLHAGAWTTLASGQLANLGDGHFAAGNVANALLHDGDLRALIENARGGTGNDTLRGNELGNALFGNGGDDLLFGDGGNDTLNGGTGRDIAAYDGVRNAYSVTRSGLTFTVSGAEGIDTATGIERLRFADGEIPLVGGGAVDMTGDGRADLLWRSSDGSLALWQSNGTASPVGVAVAASPAGSTLVAADADYNADGRSDLLWRSADGSFVFWHMNGSQAQAAITVSGVPPADWTLLDATADIGGDGRGDFLWRGPDGTTAVWHTSGSAVAGSNVVLDRIMPASWSLVDAHADFDRDGRSDFLWRNVDGRLALWRVNGSHVVEALPPSVPPPGWDIVDARGDYDGDGRSDILWRGSDGTVAVWRMSGLAVATANAVGPLLGASWVIADSHGDYNADGVSDILWRNSDGRVAVWQMADGAVAASVELGQVPDMGWTIIDGHDDYDGDGKSDILWRNTDGTVALWQMDGAAIGTTMALTPGLGSQWQTVGTSDTGAGLSGDGANNVLRGTVNSDHMVGGAGNDLLAGGAGNDIIDGGVGRDVAQFAFARSAYTITQSGGTVTVTGAEGVDTLTAIERLQFADLTVDRNAISKVDVNADNKADILWRDAQGQIAVWQMNGANVAGSAAFSPIAPAAWRAVAVNGDYDGDGKSDILLRNTNGSLEMWRMDGTAAPTVAALAAVPSLSWRIADAHGDYDGDGRSDILWRHTDGSTAVWLMNGTEVAGTALIATPAGSGWSVIDAQADYDGDGKSDVLWRNADGTAAISRVDGINAASPTVLAVVPTSWYVLDTHGDYNGDGRNDILWRNSDGTLALWQMRGAQVEATTTFASPLNWSVGDTHGDYNGDGKSDIVFRDTGGALAIWLMDGTSVPLATLASASTPPNMALLDGHSDFNADGKSDLLWRDSAGNVQVFSMNGSQVSSSTSLGNVPASHWTAMSGGEAGATLDGTSGSNVLRGTVNADAIAGGAGNDTLTGNAGADRFVFDTPLNPATNVDTISDFTPGTDVLQLSDVIFANPAAGPLMASSFVAEAGASVHDANDFVLYDTVTGSVSYDADGNGAGAAVVFANLANHAALTALDVQVGWI